MWQTLKIIFDMLLGVSKVVEKAIPPDEIRIRQSEMKAPRLEQNEKIIIYDKAFRRLKNHPEIDIATDVAFNYDNLNAEDRAELIELLTARITEYRKKHRILFKKWLTKNKHI